jgi:hypothetical protein
VAQAGLVPHGACRFHRKSTVDAPDESQPPPGAALGSLLQFMNLTSFEINSPNAVIFHDRTLFFNNAAALSVARVLQGFDALGPEAVPKQKKAPTRLMQKKYQNQKRPRRT